MAVGVSLASLHITLVCGVCNGALQPDATSRQYELLCDASIQLCLASCIQAAHSADGLHQDLCSSKCTKIIMSASCVQTTHCGCLYQPPDGLLLLMFADDYESTGLLGFVCSRTD